MLGYSDATLRALKQAGSAMIFFGAESGSDWVLEQMNKQLTGGADAGASSPLKRTSASFPSSPSSWGIRATPQRDIDEGIAFVRKIKSLNPDAEIILQHYTPTPQRDSMYGGVDEQMTFPATLEEWATPRWYNFTVRTDTNLPWLPAPLKQRVDDFETVVSSRWPTAQDFRMPGVGSRPC